MKPLHLILLCMLANGLIPSNSISAPANPPALIPRDILFGNPERTLPQISPDGKRLAWLAPNDQNVLQVWVQTIGQTDQKIVTADKKRGIRQYFWAENSQILIYSQDQDGDENWHLFGVDLTSGSVRDYTPFPGARAQPLATDRNFPDQMLVTLNQRNRQLFDVHRVNLKTGQASLDTENPGDVANWNVDPQFNVRAASIQTPDGGTEIRIRPDVKSPWKTLVKVGSEEILNFISFTANGKSVILRSSVGSDTARVIEKNIESGAEKVIASSDAADASGIQVHPTRHTVEAVSFAPDRLRWTVVDPSVQADFDGIAKLYHGDFTVLNRDHADRHWLVAFTSDRASSRYYIWDRSSKNGSFLFVQQPKLEGLPLSEIKPVVIPSRDGLKLPSYLTLPTGLEPKNLPLVLLVHGGPWARDSWGFNATAQWLANRGFACLQVNYRGSTGYGKKFLNAGNRQWGLKMHDDLIDAVDWAIREGYANPKKVAIFGGSYGGYAALAGLTFTPEKFACAVDIVGPSNLRTLLNSIPPYWKPIRSMFDVRMGSIDDPKDAELIKNASPLFKADKIVRPLLIGQGANDPRVKQAESEQIVSAIEKNGGHVVYVLYPDEGHGFARPENRIDFNARAEAFLAQHLGGRFEPLPGERYPGASAIVKVVGQPPAKKP